MGRFSLARKLATSLLVAFLVGALAAAVVRLRPTPAPDDPERAVRSGGAADQLETAFFDRLASRDAARRTAGTDLVLVTIDEASVKRARETAGGWPWPREYLGTLVRELRALGARLVVLDTTFTDGSRLKNDDVLFAQALEVGAVVAGFSFADVPEEGVLEPGRWAILQGSHATRGAALLAAAPLLARGGRPYLVAAGDRLQVWLGGYRDKAGAERDAARLKEPGARDAPTLRELRAEETLDRVTADVLFAERNAVGFAGAAAHELKTFQNLQAPIAEVVASDAAFGNLRLERDADGVVRSVRHLWRYEGRYYPSLALAAAMALTGRREVSLEGGRLFLGDLSVPVDGDGVSRLRFYGSGPAATSPDSPYPIVPVLALVRSAERRAEGKSLDERLSEKLRDKVVLVSFEVAECERTATPTHRESSHASAVAVALDNLLRSDGVLRASVEQDGAAAFAMALLGALFSMFLTRGTRPLRTLFFELAATGLVGLAYVTWAWKAYQGGLWVGSAVPLMSFLGALLLATAVHFADERMAVARIRDAMGRWALPALVEQLLRRPHHLAQQGERRTMTALACGLQGFEAASRKLPPRELMRLLDEYVAAIFETVATGHGQVDRAVGATVVAYWGAPLPNARHAADAARCALKLKEKLTALSKRWRDKHEVELAPLLAVCTGDLLIGNLSGQGRLSQDRFAVFGPAMDAAERVMAANAGLGTVALVDEAAFEQVREDVSARELDLVRVPGRVRPLRVLELCSRRRDLEPLDRLFHERFELAIVAWRRREFQPALAAFEALALERKTDRPTAVYVERCRTLLAHPPSEEWDGVFEPPPPAREG